MGSYSGGQGHLRELWPRPFERQNPTVSDFREIGLWKGPEAPDLPNVMDFVDESQDPIERESTATSLDAGTTHRPCLHGTFRMPGLWCSEWLRRTNGRTVHLAGRSWPHYVRAHHVRLPDEVTMRLRLSWEMPTQSSSVVR